MVPPVGIEPTTYSLPSPRRAARDQDGRGAAPRPAPPRGVVIESPLARPLREVVIDGHTRPATDPRRLLLGDIPHEVELRY